MRFVLLLIFSVIPMSFLSSKDDGELYNIILSDIEVEIQNRLPENIPYFLITDYRVCLDDYYIRTNIDGGCIRDIEYAPDPLSMNTYCTVEKIDERIINLSDNMKIVEYKDVMWFHEQKVYNLIDIKSKNYLPVRVIFF